MPPNGEKELLRSGLARADRSTARQRPRFHPSNLVVLAVLLVLPLLALNRATFPVTAQWIGGWVLAASVFTFFVYRSDKRRAESGTWRTPETTLQLMALVGGWPGAFIAQRVFRHKISKASFQIVFWLIVLTQQFIALDFLLAWRISKDVSHYLKTLS